jgi:hypothetical protein
MTNEQFQIFLDRNGSDPARWPTVDRAAAERLLAHDSEARVILASAQRLDAALARHGRNADHDDVAATRVLARLSGTLPRQKAQRWRLPTVLLDWQFAPEWPRVAALGACAVIGFAIGLSGVDRHIDGFDQTFAAAPANDVGALVFEPEALTGARP